MNRIFKENRFYPQNFFVRTNDSTDTDAIIREIAEKASAISPESFDAEVKSFTYVLQYQPPYVKNTDFQEIRNLQREAISKTRFKDEYNGYIGIDITEWVEHCEEEHFINCIGALRKMAAHWKYVFFAEDSLNKADIDKTLKIIRGIIWTKELSADTFGERRLSDRLSEVMKNKHNINLNLSGQKIIKDIFSENRVISDNAVSDMASDMAAYFGDVFFLNKKALIDYLSDDTYARFIMNEDELIRLKDITKEGEVKG